MRNFVSLIVIGLFSALDASAHRIPDRAVPPCPYIAFSYGLNYELPRSDTPGVGQPSYGFGIGYELMGHAVVKLSPEASFHVISPQSSSAASSVRRDLVYSLGFRVAHLQQDGTNFSHYFPPFTLKAGLSGHSFTESQLGLQLVPYWGVGIELSGRTLPMDLYADYVSYLVSQPVKGMTGIEIGLRYYLGSSTK